MSQADFSHYLECSLSLAVELVNTENPVSGEDTLTSVDALGAFLRAQGISGFRAPTRADLEAAPRVRAQLRAIFEAPDEAHAGALINAMLAGSGAQPVLTNHDGPWHLHYAPTGGPLGPRLTAETAMTLAVVIAQGDFQRMHLCAADDCVDVFIDRSRNQSRRYCSPGSCGNRANVAAFRARRRAPAT